jgi:hypothetical protein
MTAGSYDLINMFDVIRSIDPSSYLKMNVHEGFS